MKLSVETTMRIVIPANASVTMHDANPVPAHIDTVIYEMGDNAHLTLLQEQAHYHDQRTITYRYMLARNAQLRLFFIAVDNTQLMIKQEFIMHQERSNMYVRGLVALADSERYTVETIQHHKAPHTSSDLMVNACVADAGNVTYHGSIIVEQEAPFVHAVQRAPLLLIGERARAFARPTLQVHTNEVRCTHGSAIGRLNQDQLQYLLSRGVSDADAQQLLIEGFFADIVQNVPDAVRDRWLHDLMSRLSLSHYKKS